MKYPKRTQTGPGSKRKLNSRGFKIGVKWATKPQRRKKRRH